MRDVIKPLLKLHIVNLFLVAVFEEYIKIKFQRETQKLLKNLPIAKSKEPSICKIIHSLKNKKNCQ